MKKARNAAIGQPFQTRIAGIWAPNKTAAGQGELSNESIFNFERKLQMHTISNLTPQIQLESNTEFAAPAEVHEPEAPTAGFLHGLTFKTGNLLASNGVKILASCMMWSGAIALGLTAAGAGWPVIAGLAALTLIGVGLTLLSAKLSAMSEYSYTVFPEDCNPDNLADCVQIAIGGPLHYLGFLAMVMLENCCRADNSDDGD